jgi:hypothetical protein
MLIVTKTICTCLSIFLSQKKSAPKKEALKAFENVKKFTPK